jgi:glycosyltransferase involved in cell wall biosynthesis
MKILLDLQGCQAVGSRNRGIGRYSLALAKAMVAAGPGHEFHVLLNGRFPDTIARLETEFEGLLPPGRIAVFHPPAGCAEVNCPDGWRTHAAEVVRRLAIQELRPDVLHVGSLFEGLVDDCVTSISPPLDRVPTAVTLFDLIPFLNPKRYLFDDRTIRWHDRKIESLRRADVLLAISGSAADEARGALGIERVVNISSAADAALFHPGPTGDAQARLGIDRPFVMYTGGIDWRKNIEGLVRAYALLPQELRRHHQLVLVCHAEAYARMQLESVARDAGLAPHELVMTGYVSDEDLADLYRSCSLFVFPSLHEGFGLPALEAMMCGAAVIGSNASSIPEVIGREDALFDPRSDEVIAALMRKGLEDTAFRDSLRAHAGRQAARFSWSRTATRALAALEEMGRKTPADAPPARNSAKARPRLAMHAPLPPARSGIADYTVELVAPLRECYDIDLVYDQPEVALPPALADLPVRSVAWFREHSGEFDRIVYQFGNSMFHAHMFQLLREHPGVVVLHDFFLSGVLNWMDTVGLEPGALEEALFGSHGRSAVDDARKIGRDAAAMKYPASGEVLRLATGVIVHSAYAVESARRWFGAAAASSMRQVPLLHAAPPEPDRDAARAALGIGREEFIVCTFGHVAPTKLNVRALQAWGASALAGDTNCRFITVGGDRPPYGDEVRRALRGVGRASITGFVDRETYERYLAAADVAVQLRSGGRGETSAAVLDALAFGVPVIANSNGSNAEYPDDAIVKLPEEFTDEELITALQALRADGAVRERLANAGREWVKQHHDPQAVARAYRDAVEGFAAEPAHANLREAIRAIAQLRADPAEGDLVEVAAALAATSASLRDRAGDTRAPSPAR